MASSRFGATQASGARAVSRTAAGQSPGLRRYAATLGATCRPSRAQTSAVSAGCMRFPAREHASPSRRSAGSTSRPGVPRSSSQPAITASSWSGIQSAVKTTRSHSTVLVSPESISVNSTDSTRSDPWIALTLVRDQTGARESGRPLRRGRPATFDASGAA